MSTAVKVPWNSYAGWKAFDRDRLQTAYLLALDEPPAGLVRALMDNHGMGHTEAVETAAAARICLSEGIEP